MPSAATAGFGNRLRKGRSLALQPRQADLMGFKRETEGQFLVQEFQDLAGRRRDFRPDTVAGQNDKTHDSDSILCGRYYKAGDILERAGRTCKDQKSRASRFTADTLFLLLDGRQFLPAAASRATGRAPKSDENRRTLMRQRFQRAYSVAATVHASVAGRLRGKNLEVQLLGWPTHRSYGCVPTGSVARARRTEPGEIPEAEAIRLAQQGDAAAFERLYRLHSRRVYSLCLRMVSNTAEAEDLTQEAFLQLFRKIATFRGESAFSTWLHRLAVNVVLMKLRKKSGNESVARADHRAGRGKRGAAAGFRGPGFEAQRLD